MDGDGPGGAVTPMVGWGSQPPSRSCADHAACEHGPCVCAQSGHSRLCGRIESLWDCCPTGVPVPCADGTSRTAPARCGARLASRPGHQALRSAARGQGSAAGGACGTAEAIATVPATTGGGTTINTAYIERLNATFRSALAPLVRRGRAIAHKEAVLTAGMYLVGCAYNFCWYHDSLRLVAPEGAHTGSGRNGHPRWPQGLPIIVGLCASCCYSRSLCLLELRPSSADVHPSKNNNL
jgi:hypothetical protein